MSADVSIHTTKEISKGTESFPLNLEHNNIQEISKAIKNAKSDCEMKISKTEEDYLPIEKTQSMDNVCY